MPPLQPKTYLITGAARGIGRGLSRLLLERGQRVFLLDSDEAELAHTVARLGAQRPRQRGRDFEAVTCDVRVPGEIARAVERVGEFCERGRGEASSSSGTAGGLDCLVNNAAYTATVGTQPLATLSLDSWTRTLETNLTAPMLLTQACLPLLKRTRGGSVVHISSTRAFMSEPHNEAYAATKAGLLGLNQALAVSLGPEGVRSNAILPGWIHVANECREADEKGTAWEEGLSREDQRWHLAGRVGRVEDVLRAVEYCVESEFVTGAELVVDGGVTRKMVYPE